MASDDPLPDRCAAMVTDRVGLEVHFSEPDIRADAAVDFPESERDDYEFVVFDDGLLDAITLTKGAITTERDAEYDDVVSYRNNGFHTNYVTLVDDGSTVDVDVDDDAYITHRTTELQGYCERYPMKEQNRCYVHGGSNPGAEEGNSRAVTHGLKAKRSNYYRNVLSDEEKLLVERFVDDWLDRADFTRDNHAMTNELFRISVDQIRLWKAQDEFEDGIVTEQVVDFDPDSGPITRDEENPANLPYDRLDRTTYSKLKDLGVLDSPEDKQAEATESLAAKFSQLDDS